MEGGLLDGSPHHSRWRLASSVCPLHVPILHHWEPSLVTSQPRPGQVGGEAPSHKGTIGVQDGTDGTWRRVSGPLEENDTHLAHGVLWRPLVHAALVLNWIRTPQLDHDGCGEMELTGTKGTLLDLNPPHPVTL